MDTSIIFPNLHISLDNVGKHISIGNFTIAYYGIIIAIGMLVGVSLILKEAKRVGFDDDMFLDICIITIILSVIGARAYYVIFSWDLYKDNPINILNIRQGGLAIYGGVLTGIVTVAVISKIKKLKFLAVTDVCILGVVVGQIFGRWGNFFNREAFGQYTNSLFAMLLPTSAVRSSDITSEMLENLVTINGVDYVSVHPTFLYESVWNLCLLLIMLYMRKRKKTDGQIFFTYLIGYGAGRFWIESLRTDQLLLWGTNIAVSQVVASAMVVIGIICMVYNLKIHPLSTTEQ